MFPNISIRYITVVAGTLLIIGGLSWTTAIAQVIVDSRVERIHAAAAEHCIQEEMLAIVDPHERFEAAFECGDELFETRFNALDGVGANVGDNQRFSRVPRADKNGSTEWANHFPERATGPNAEACNICHNDPFDDGSGAAGANVIRDPLHAADPGQFINRNTPHLFAPGAVQRLAEEMTQDLFAIRAQAIADANNGGGGVCDNTPTNAPAWRTNRAYAVGNRVSFNSKEYQALQSHTSQNGWQPPNVPALWSRVTPTGVCPWEVQVPYVIGSQVTFNGGTFSSTQAHTSQAGWEPPNAPNLWQPGSSGSVTRQLITKGVSFGSITAHSNGSVDTSGVNGVDHDLIVKPFQWKGNTLTLRDFNRGASHNELGMQAVEITGDNHDGDGDGVVNEFGIGDQTALAIYIAAQPRPVSSIELNNIGLLDPALTAAQINAIQQGSTLFEQIGCAACHRPALTVNDPIFSEPSQKASHRDAVFPAGQNPLARGVDPNNPVRFDLTADQPDNIIEVGNQQIRLGSFERAANGGAIVRLYGDLKRHDMGSGLAESIDETGAGASVWITKELWGVGSTAPYLHDGRATTLSEAILLHGGEAKAARDAAQALSDTQFGNLVAFLNSLLLFKQE